ncbi:ankyrin repeat domain-containing protein [Pendulispora albinea]|uniref:Ankyrin repeat domain-containing protein n=1 Tax=Pendulispora albinea TaxID=2741071 RepID=A0ABZ2LMF7_9BACT
MVISRLTSLLLSVVLLTSAACDSKDKEKSSVGRTVDTKEVFSDPAVVELAEATAKGDPVKIKPGTNVNAVGSKGVSLLQWAMLNKSKAGFQSLLDAGADTSHTDEMGDAVMHYAAKAEDPTYLDMLLARKVDPNTPNAVTWHTPLMGALMAERKEHFRKLLAAGANPNLAERLGNTSLHVAAKINENQLLLEMLKAGADPTAKNKQGLTFQRYLNMTPQNILSAEAKGQRENVLTWLREHNVPVET